MKLSLYTFVRNGLFYDFHVEAMLRHHVPYVDEIIVNEGYSDDGTFEAISNIDPKVQVHRFEWDRSDPNGWHRHFKNQARQLCTGDWCILLDCDEFIPEWEFDRMRGVLERTPHDLVRVRFYHFYGNYKVYLARSRAIIPDTGIRIHRNTPEVEVWGDGANVRIRGHEGPIDAAPEIFDVHHFGNVRHPARLRQKWRTQAKQHDAKNPKWDKTPSVLFDLFPHKWDDAEFMQYLGVYEGPFIEAVRQHPDEFVRDDFWLYEHCRQAQISG
jgi:glycosyltransferase involved in cell wall biosynthesis